MKQPLSLFDGLAPGFSEVLLASIGDGVIAVDESGAVTFLNAVAEELVGQDREQALGKPIEEVLPIINEATGAEVPNPTRTVLETGDSVELANHTLLVRPDGSQVPIDDSAAPMRDPTGKLIGAVLVFRSIADRRHAERQMEEDRRVQRLVAEVAQAVAQSPALPEMADRVCRALVKHLDAAFARIWTCNHDQTELVLRASAGQYTHLDGSHARVPVGRLKIGEIASTQQPHLTNNVIGDPRVDQDWAREQGMVAFAGYPIMLHGGCQGVMAVFAKAELSELAIRSLESISQIVAGSIDRHQAIDSLQSAQEYFECIVESIREPLLVLDEDFSVRSANRAYCELFDVAEKELIGRHFFDLDPGQWDKPRLRRLLEEVISLNRSFDNFAVSQRIDGVGRRRMLLNARRIDRPGQQAPLVLLAIEDVTERWRLQREKVATENRFRSMIEQVSDYAVFMFDTEGRAMSWNDGVKEVLGYDEEEFLGKPIGPMIFTDKAVQEGVPEWEMSQAAKSGSANDDRWMKRKGGKRFWASGITTAAFDHDGNLLGYNKILRDLTARKRADNAIRDLNAQLSATDARKNEFIATLAHELRNPLSPIATVVSLMRDCAGNPQEVETLRAIAERQVEVLGRLVDDLMDVSRIGRGKVELQKSVCQLAEVVEDAVESSTPLIQESRHTLSVDLPNEPIHVDGDRVRLTQVVTNLLNNAAKYTPTGGRIHLSLASQGGEAVLVVTDNGIGVPQDQRSHLFDLFSQLEPQSLSGKHGLGVGLALVKQLVELHGGSIEVFSEGQDQGARFEVRLPVCTDRSPQAEADPSAPPHAAPSPRRVLVIDDQRAISFTLGRLLERMGHEVATASNGAEAIDLLGTFPAEVVISDISMPEMNGYELAEAVRAKYGDQIKLVAMSGYGMKADRDRAIASGFNHHMVKPPDARLLEEFFQSIEA